jgi:3-oxoacyl-(acyl-carrier-protein) synthase
MSLIIKGMGAVSPAGWGVEALLQAVEEQTSIETTSITRPLIEGGERATPVYSVPSNPLPAIWGRHPRMRRVSAISKFLVAAAMESLGSERIERCLQGDLRVAILFCTVNGCVQYSNRFFSEALADPALASPILFPETVFNAPSSHLSAVIGSSSINDSLLGDDAEFFTALQMAEELLERGDADGCLVIGAEELDWLSAEALTLYHKKLHGSEGAGALYLESSGEGIAIISPTIQPYVSDKQESVMSSTFREVIDRNIPIVTSLRGISRIDHTESELLHNHQAPLISPRTLLGEGLSASTAHQVIIAAESIKRGKNAACAVLTVGSNEQAGYLKLTNASCP